MSFELDIHFFGGMTPVQCWGLVNRRSFYFRARWTHWSFEIGEARLVPSVSDEDVGQLDFYLEEPFGEGQYDAGYMPFGDSRRIVADCLARYAAQTARSDPEQVRKQVKEWFDDWLGQNPDYELARQPP